MTLYRATAAGNVPMTPEEEAEFLAPLIVRALAQAEPPIATELAKFAVEEHDSYLSDVSPALLMCALRTINSRSHPG